MALRDDVPRLLTAAGLLVLTTACSAEPYPMSTARQPPWNLERSAGLPAADPPYSDRAQRFGLCYGWPLNNREEALAVAEARCPSGRLVVERRDAFWNGCGLFQPMRATYICDPVAGSPDADLSGEGAADEAVSPDDVLEREFSGEGIFDDESSDRGIYGEEIISGEEFEEEVQDE